MRCHVCNAEVGEGQRFCHECGESLAGVTDTTQELSRLPSEPLDDPDEAQTAPGSSAATAARSAGAPDPAGEAREPTDSTIDPDAPLAGLGDTQQIPQTDPAGGAPEPDDTTANPAATLAGRGDTQQIPQTDPAETQPIPEANLADTQEVPASELPGAPPTPEPDPTHVTETIPDPAPEHDEPTAAGLAPPDPDAVRGPIGASLFDPATAPPDAGPEWGEPTFEPTAGGPDTDTDIDTPAGTDHFAGGADGSGDAAATTNLAATTVAAANDPYASADVAAGLATGPQPMVYDVETDRASEPLLAGEIQPFRVRPAFVMAFLGMLTMLMVSIADLTDIRTDRPVAGIPNCISTIDDIGTNLAIAGFIGAALMLVGGLLQCFHLRWGAGLAGGAGLAIVGWAALTIGLIEVPIDSAERITRDPNTPGPFTLTVTRDLGYWLIVAVAGIGLVVFLLSLVSAGTGGRRGLNPWTAALGAVTALVIAAGPLITVGGASFDVNFGTDNLPAAFFAGRLTQLVLIALAGVVGFLLVRTYGLGLVAGGISVAIWLWVSSLLEIGDRPLGIAAGNLGSNDTTPHAVTTFGVASTVLLLIVAATIAIVRSRSKPRA